MATISQWEFDGDARDSIGVNHAELIGDPTFAASIVSSETGGQALDLDGSRQFALILDDDSLDITGSYWISAWVERGTDVGEQVIFRKGLSYELSMPAGNGVGIGHQSETLVDYGCLTATDMIPGRVYRLDGVFDETARTLSVYVNGRLAKVESGIDEGPKVSTSDLSIGAHAEPKRFWSGRIDKVRLRDHVPTDAEVLDEYRLESNVIFADSFETGDLSMWATQQEVGTGARLTVITEDPVPYEGNYSLQAAVGDGAERAETIPGEIRFSEGDDVYFRHKVFFKEPFPSDDDPPTWGSLVWQLRDEGDGSPVMSLTVGGRDPFIDLSGGPATGLAATTYWRAPLEVGRWYDFILHIFCHEDERTGFVEVWVDGEQQELLVRFGQTALGSAYPKYGIYRDLDFRDVGEVAIDEVEMLRSLPVWSLETRIVSAPQSGDSTTAKFEFIGPENTVEFQARADGGDWAIVASPHFLHGLSVGHHVFEVRALGIGGNFAREPAVWNWDRFTDRLRSMLRQLPPFMRGDIDVRAILRVAGNEIDLFEAKMAEMIANFTPQNADIYLMFWEHLFRIPVESPSKTLEQRRQTVVAYLRRLSQGGPGFNWVARVIDLIGFDWQYVVNNPQGILGLAWERFFDTNGWEWETTNQGNIGINDPSGWIPRTNSLFEVWKNIPAVIDQEATLQFVPGTRSAGAIAGVEIKRQDNDDTLAILWANDVLTLYKRVGGRSTSLDTLAAALTLGERYWVKGRIEDDDVLIEVWDADPSKENSARALFSRRFTLSGGDERIFGRGLSGRQGVWFSGLSPTWLIRQFRANEVGYTVPENTLRVTIPYTEDSYQAIEILAFLRDITPANTDIEVFIDEGFILGESLLGVQGL
jgi:uncharacterized protein YmfQ (DUF2313 family)